MAGEVGAEELLFVTLNQPGKIGCISVSGGKFHRARHWRKKSMESAAQDALPAGMAIGNPSLLNVTTSVAGLICDVYQ